MDHSEYKHLYKTEKWKRISEQFRLAHPVCAFCGEKAQVVDHIKPHKGNVGLFFSNMNLQSLCKRCHDGPKARIEAGQVPGKDFVIDNRADSDGLPTSSNHPWND